MNLQNAHVFTFYDTQLLHKVLLIFVLSRDICITQNTLARINNIWIHKAPINMYFLMIKQIQTSSSYW